MSLTRHAMLTRARARDARYDGRFLTGVLSTGIYCLPSCPARRPRAENVRFYDTAREARAAGLRACLRCRPDDFLDGRDPDADLARRIASAAMERPSEHADAAGVGRAFGVGSTRLNALFRRHYHMTPAAFLQRARLDTARAMLLRRTHSVLDAALEIGYESLSAFNDAFRRHHAVTPGRVRSLRGTDAFVLSLPPRYRAEEILAHLARDPESPTERRAGGRLGRAVRLPGGIALLHLEIGDGEARCRIETDHPIHPDDAPDAHLIALRLMGLRLDPDPFERRVRRVARLAPLVRRRPGLRLPLAPEPFETLVWSIVGQQIHLGLAFTLRRALLDLCGAPAPGGLTAHPLPGDVARLGYADLTRRKFSRRKAEYLIDTARLVHGGDLPLDSLSAEPAGEIERRLLAVRGIGPWSAHYMMMRGLGLADCVPAGDSGLRTALRRFFGLDRPPDADEVRTLMEPFAPHRSLATAHLWASLGDEP